MNPPEHPFDEPWQAQVFALTLALHERGLFSWPEWAQALGAALGDAAPDGSDYYARWLVALETLLEARGQADNTEIAALAARWQVAAHATPHGQPIRLENAAD
ncbi:MAG: nitrile hydratase accessory protein [Pararhodobacter sp.]